jgi:hypothetical protein
MVEVVAAFLCIAWLAATNSQRRLLETLRVAAR